MASAIPANAPITVTEAFLLPTVGINKHFITFTHVTMESDKYICVRETAPQNSIVIIDMSMPNQPLRRPITADSALMNPNSKILALKGQIQGTTEDHLQIFNIEMKAKLKSYLMPEQIIFWKWITPKMLGLVTQTSVYHWSIEGESEPVKVFERTANLANNQIINYRCDPSEKWLVLIGIAPGDPVRPQLVKGNLQLFSVDQERSQALEAHAASFAQYKVPGNETPSILISFATKTLNAGQITSKLHVIELGAQPGKPCFTQKQADLFFPPDFADDFPVAMQMSHKYSLIYVITKLGLLFVYDLETASAVYRNRISRDPIFLTTEASSVGGFYAVNRKGQVLLATINEQTIVPFVSDQLNNLELAVNLAMRGNLPGAENMVVQRFQELFAQTKYKEAAELAAESPQGILRTPDTVAKFQSVHVQIGQTPPLLVYFATLLTRGKLNAFESVELSRLVVNQNKKNLVENWLAEDKLECSEELGDLVKTVDDNLALKIYIKARATPKVTAAFAERREVEATGNAMESLETTPPKSSTSLHSDEPAPSQKYDVFLSFRGEDTRKGFLSHLYHELQNTRVIKTFKDDQQLKKGTAISSNLLTAIEESRFAIIILSQNYASSTWCLDELAKIYQCMKDKDTILPIFYNVDPSDVRHQRKSFEEAFTVHNKSEDENKVKQWKVALKGVASTVGWDIKNHRSERELVEDIVRFIWRKVLEVPIGDFEAFETTRQAMVKLMKALKDDEITVIGVHGMAGIGKTTMVKHVSTQVQKNGLFDNVIMAVISQSPNLQTIQGTLANLLGMNLEEGTESGRASRLKEMILSGNRILIILDDIWERIEFSSIGLPSYEELRRCMSKVIFTTRISNVCGSMQCHAEIHLNILSDEDSWKLLSNMSGKSFLEFTESYNEARKVARKCNGLPNALKAAARALGDICLNEWNEAVAREFGDNKWEEAPQPSTLQPNKPKNETAVSQLMISDDVRSCFMLCCLFPKGFDIPIEELLKYGIGKGLFQDSDTIQEARDRIYAVVEYLKVCRLLLNGTKNGYVKMHDEEVAMSIALSTEGLGALVKAGCELKDWPMDVHDSYSAISLMRNKLHRLPENLVCPKLQILLLQGNVGISDIPNTFLQSPNILRVFDLSFTNIAILPSSFSLLSNLQTLNLDSCNKLMDISILGRLSKLEILSMRRSPLKKFPKEIGHLTNLRMLDFTGGYVDIIPSKVLSRLYRLEELHMKVEFGDWGSRVKGAVEETNADFHELTGLLYLNILKVYISNAACLPKNVVDFKPNWVEYDICISKDVPWDMVLNDHPSRTLTLDTTIKSLPDWFINVVAEKAENLEYINCKDLSNILVEYNHGRLHRLKYLSVNGRHKNLEELMNAMTWIPDNPVFENLEKMQLLYLQSLKQLCVGELPPGSLRNLKMLKVQTCRSLENALLPSKLLQRLQSLEKIICVNMEGMKYVCSFEGLDPEKILLTKLKEMRLCSLVELVNIWNGPAPHAIFHNLQVLAVCECKKLKNLFTFDVAKCLFQLEDLCIEHCPNLNRVIDASESLNSKILWPALKNLALISLPELTSFLH